MSRAFGCTVLLVQPSHLLVRPPCPLLPPSIPYLGGQAHRQVGHRHVDVAAAAMLSAGVVVRMWPVADPLPRAPRHRAPEGHRRARPGTARREASQRLHIDLLSIRLMLVASWYCHISYAGLRIRIHREKRAKQGDDPGGE